MCEPMQCTSLPHHHGAPQPTWKFMCSLCCAGVWRVRKRRIMRSSLRFSSPSVKGKGGQEINHQHWTAGKEGKGSAERHPAIQQCSVLCGATCRCAPTPCPANRHLGSQPLCSAQPARRRCGGRAPAPGCSAECPGCETEGWQGRSGCRWNAERDVHRNISDQFCESNSTTI